MPPQKTKFSDKWLQRSMVDHKDSQANSFKVDMKTFGYKTFSITNIGFGQIVL